MLRRAFFLMVRLVLWLAVVASCGFAFYYTYANGGVLGVVGSAIVLCALVIWPAYTPIPTMNYGTVLFLGIRTGKALREGPHFTLPLLETVRLFRSDVALTRVNAKLYTLDGLIVHANGVVRWRINPQLLATTFMENFEAIPEWLAGKVEHELQAVAGKHKAADFVCRKDSVVNLMNCVLRMGAPPHLKLQIAPEDLLSFYSGDILNSMVRSEDRLAEEYSEAESECGIEVLSFVTVFEFNPATDAAMELEGQTKLQLAADKLTAEQELKLVRDLKAEGLDTEQAVEAAEVVLGRSKRKIFSLGLDKFKPFGK